MLKSFGKSGQEGLPADMKGRLEKAGRHSGRQDDEQSGR